MGALEGRGNQPGDHPVHVVARHRSAPLFTGPAVTDDGERLLFISDRTGNPNLFALDMDSGEILQLTDNRRGVLLQYVFPWGNPVGFGKSSVILNSARGHAYYVQGREVRKVDVRTAEEVCIAVISPGYVTAFTHVSTDDSLLCVPIVEEAAFADCLNDGFGGIERAIQDRGLKSLLWVVATDGSMQAVRAEQQSWITHVQFRPDDNRYILFNNEAIGKQAGKQRVWMSDGESGEVWKIRPEPEDREHWNCHELWRPDGSEILYHGQGNHPETGEYLSFYGFSDLSGRNYREFFVRKEDDHGYGHFALHLEKDAAYCDGYFSRQHITEVRPADGGYVKAETICRHGTQWLAQDDHPHPILTPGGKMLIYSSSTEGTGNVYGVTL